MSETTTRRVTIIQADESVLAQYFLGEGEHSVGREPGCAVHIENSFISRNHATLTLRDDRVSIEDLGSTAGTFLDGAPIRGRVEVLPTQTLKLHDLILRIESGERDKIEPGGKLAGGRFTLIRKVGQGGMGVVWLARDEQLEEPVALKLLTEDLANDGQAMEDLKRETQKSRRLTHPNIIRIHDLVQLPGASPFIVMEFVDGSELENMRLRQPQRFFAWDEIEELVLQLCGALEYAHEQMIVHRDLKPANVIVTEDQKVRLADFGVSGTIASATRRAKSVGEISGTPMFMSPQQLQGEEPQVTDDVYAFGAMLFELLTSRPPFYDGDIVHQVLETPAPSLRKQLSRFALQNPVPEYIHRLVAACLEKDPADRPASAREVADWIRNQGPRAGSFVIPDEPGMAPKSEEGIEPVAVPGEPVLEESAPENPSTHSTTRRVVQLPDGGSEKKKFLVVGAAAVFLMAGVIWLLLDTEESGSDSPSAPPRGPVTVVKPTNPARLPVKTPPNIPSVPTKPPPVASTNSSPVVSTNSPPSGPLIKALAVANGDLATALQALVSERRITLNPSNQEVEILNLQGQQFSNAGFSRLGKLTNLVELDLLGTGVTDANLGLLAGMKRLEKLNLAETKITSAGLKNLMGLTNLKDLNFAQTEVDNTGFGLLHNMPQLERLNLGGTQVTDAVLGNLPQPGRLRFLYLDDTGITDGGLLLLARLTGLKELYLENNNGVTDMGLEYLGSLKQLTELHLQGTKATRDGVRDLQNALPRCMILHLE